MSLPIPCSTLSQKDFDAKTNAWKLLVNSEGSTAGISASLTSGGNALTNYAYLSKDYVKQLLASPASPATTVAIRTKFVLTGTPASFSLAVYGITAQGVPTTPYFLMGVAAVPASIDNLMPLLTANEEIPAAEAAAWIMNWHGQTPDGISAAPFASSAGMLLGYTFPVSDFQDPWPATTGPDAALWLNFDMHPPTFIPPVSPGQLLFSTIVTLNKVPVGNVPGVITLAPNLRYYDVSHPCPPQCDAYAPQPGPGRSSPQP